MSIWACVSLARQHDAALRVPFELFIPPMGWLRVGSVSRSHLAAVARICTDLSLGCHLKPAGPGLRLQAADAHEYSESLGRLNEALRQQGLIPGWRNETYRLCTSLDGNVLAWVERASARFWGLLTFGAHCNGYVRDQHGRPALLWIARRSALKATDPGLLDNLVGGGVPWDQTPAATLQREAWEEAGVSPRQLAKLRSCGSFTLLRDVPEGVQWEQLHAFDLEVDSDFTPLNQDGEVAAFHCLPVDEAFAHAAAGRMTVDAALVTLDFGLRHGLLPQDQVQQLAPRMAALRISPA